MKKQTAILISLIITLATFTPVILQYAQPTTIIHEYTYVIYPQENTYTAKHGVTGDTLIDTNISRLLMTCLAQLGEQNGKIVIRGGRYYFTHEAVINRSVWITGEGDNSTIFIPANDTNILRIKPSGTLIYEEGRSIRIEGIKFQDDPYTPAQTSKAAVVLDHSNSTLTGVTLQDLTFENIYDGIISYRDDGEHWFWANTIRHVRFDAFRHHAISLVNIADSTIDDVWAVSNESNVSAIRFEYQHVTTPKIGGNLIRNSRIFNQQNVSTAHGVELIDYQIITFDNCIFDLCGGNGLHSVHSSQLLIMNCWSSSSWQGNGFYFNTTPGNYAFDIMLSNCYASSNKLNGIHFEGTEGYTVSSCAVTNCLATDNTEYGLLINSGARITVTNLISGNNHIGIGDDIYSSYNTFSNCQVFDNTHTQLALNGTYTMVYLSYNGTRWIP